MLLARDLFEFTKLSTGLIAVCLVFTVLLFFTTTDDEDFYYVVPPRPTDRLFTLFYFSVSTATTVGYGDISPKSTKARFYCILFKILVFAGIISLLFNF